VLRSNKEDAILASVALSQSLVGRSTLVLEGRRLRRTRYALRPVGLPGMRRRTRPLPRRVRGRGEKLFGVVVPGRNAGTCHRNGADVVAAVAVLRRRSRVLAVGGNWPDSEVRVDLVLVALLYGALLKRLHMRRRHRQPPFRGPRLQTVLVGRKTPVRLVLVDRFAGVWNSSKRDRIAAVRNR